MGILYSLLAETLLATGRLELPGHVALFVDDDPEAVDEFLGAADEFGIERATVCVDSDGSEEDGVSEVAAEKGVGDARDREVLFLGGRDEFVSAARGVSRSVEEGDLAADSVGEDHIEDSLAISDDPDLVINTLEEGLTDFLLWQTAYSELCFVDSFDRDAFVDCLEEYAERERRFGR